MINRLVGSANKCDGNQINQSQALPTLHLLPIPDSRFPIPDSLLPTPYSLISYASSKD
ncbi:MAG: hypothetical protein F6K50_39880 [Moorea sp. SIO3I7]|uniref:hypothetical protein n=1 Tax=unclassified Moorena TaxID=2683338 RepID=UPI0013C8A7E0|nr:MULTISPECIES: hypothetical protein [unclassified Moorena]NEO01344.1 hypothetical protein [Moorena sp. SIO3I7]NEO44130.1 hypothetical protein [Moorena sp. SIO4A3]NEO16304.1 hypothetical protein [Moorena sp. SIO3E8]NEP28272.1 hypothetical protein [Moorena sp. SIO3I6]NEQ02854.1 hypothetical protein [Moorena sp. SIO3F7]